MPVFGKFAALGARQFSTTAARRSGWQQLGVPGSNLPFSIENRFALYAKVVLFFGSGMAVPFFATRHQLLKQ